MTLLSVNLNKVAHLRNTRHLNIPDVMQAVAVSVNAGAGGITVHPRPDRRHIRPHDVYDIAAFLKDHPGVEFNIEGNPFEGTDEAGYMRLVRATRPTQCTLVPDDPGVFTSCQGWDPAKSADRLRPIIQELKELGCRVSLFMDPDPEKIAAAADLQCDRIELYTEPYASAFAQPDRVAVTEQYTRAAQTAQDHGLGVNAGHDLNQSNLAHLLGHVPGILEVSIGHALVAEALFDGLEATVRAYLRIIAGVVGNGAVREKTQESNFR